MSVDPSESSQPTAVDDEDVHRPLLQQSDTGGEEDEPSFFRHDGETASLNADPKVTELNYSESTKCSLIFLAIAISGTTIANNIFIAYSTPYFSSQRLPGWAISLNWISFPISGIFGGSLLMFLSDRLPCSCCGRRRPFIIMNLILISLGLAVFPNSHLLGGGSGTIPTQVIAVASFWVASFGTYSIGVLGRALLVDRIPAKDQMTGVVIAVSLAGSLGDVLGFGLTAVPWADIFQNSEPLQPLCCVTIPLVLGISSMTCLVHEEQEEIDQKQKGVLGFLRIYCDLPCSFWLNAACMFLFMTMNFIAYIYLSIYVGEVIFHGDPDAPVGSPERILFDQGVQWCSMGLITSAVCGIVYAVLLDFLAKCIHYKILWEFGLSFGVATFLLGGFLHEKWVIFVILPMFGIANATMSTIPWTLTMLITKADKRLSNARATVQNLFQLSFSTPAILVSLTSGWVVKFLEDVMHFGLGSLFVVCAIIGVGSMILILFVVLPKGVAFKME